MRMARVDRSRKWREYEGGVQDWLIQSKRSRDLTFSKQEKSSEPSRPPTPTNSLVKTTETSSINIRTKLSNKDQRELDALPEKISALEAEQSQIRLKISDSQLYVKDPEKATILYNRDAAIDDELIHCLNRWEKLSSPPTKI